MTIKSHFFMLHSHAVFSSFFPFLFCKFHYNKRREEKTEKITKTGCKPFDSTLVETMVSRYMHNFHFLFEINKWTWARVLVRTHTHARTHGTELACLIWWYFQAATKKKKEKDKKWEFSVIVRSRERASMIWQHNKQKWNEMNKNVLRRFTSEIKLPTTM